jgi:ADP-ribose pyrophosphatase YjhB (NUDIX family)
MARSLIARLAQTWFRLTRPMTLGVRIAAFDAQGRICLIRHTYMSGWHLPGGGVEKGETAIEAAVKELREETGLVALPDDLRLVSIHANFANFPGDHVLLYTCSHYAETGIRNAREIAEQGFFAVDTLPEGTSGGTRARLRELAGSPASANWIA